MKKRGIKPNPLALVKRLAREKKVRFEGKSVTQRARDELGFGVDDILDAVQKLRHEDLRVESRPTTHMPGCVTDYYGRKNLHQKQDVYFHFYVDTKKDELVIDSCHKFT